MTQCPRCGFVERPTYDETGPLAFWRAIESHRVNKPRFAPHLTRYTVYDYARMRCFLRLDGAAGYALTKAGEVVSLFNAGEPGAGREALADAVKRGGKTLFCFDGFLPGYYKRAGFIETERAPFDPEQAPADWNVERDGQPDVVWMRHVTATDAFVCLP